MYNYTYTPLTVKVVCTIGALFARDFAAMGSYSFNPKSRFPDHSAKSTEEDCIGKAHSALLKDWRTQNQYL